MKANIVEPRKTCYRLGWKGSTICCQRLKKLWTVKLKIALHKIFEHSEIPEWSHKTHCNNIIRSIYFERRLIRGSIWFLRWFRMKINNRNPFRCLSLLWFNNLWLYSIFWDLLEYSSEDSSKFQTSKSRMVHDMIYCWNSEALLSRLRITVRYALPWFSWDIW